MLDDGAVLAAAEKRDLGVARLDLARRFGQVALELGEVVAVSCELLFLRVDLALEGLALVYLARELRVGLLEALAEDVALVLERKQSVLQVGELDILLVQEALEFLRR